MPKYSIPADGFTLILISFAILILAVLLVEPLQAGQNSLVNYNAITNTTELLYNASQHAKELIDEGTYEQALQILNETLSIDPNFTDALTNKGRALYYLSQYDEAIEYFDRAIGINPNYTLARNGKGNALSDLGQYDEAIEYFDSKP